MIHIPTHTGSRHQTRDGSSTRASFDGHDSRLATRSRGDSETASVRRHFGERAPRLPAAYRACQRGLAPGCRPRTTADRWSLGWIVEPARNRPGCSGQAGSCVRADECESVSANWVLADR
jgi:hypothetical protein